MATIPDFTDAARWVVESALRERYDDAMDAALVGQIIRATKLEEIASRLQDTRAYYTDPSPAGRLGPRAAAQRSAVQ